MFRKQTVFGLNTLRELKINELKIKIYPAKHSHTKKVIKRIEYLHLWMGEVRQQKVFCKKCRRVTRLMGGNCLHEDVAIRFDHHAK